MTVKELIEKLNNIADKDSEIRIEDNNDDEYPIQEDIAVVQWGKKHYYILKVE